MSVIASTGHGGLPTIELSVQHKSSHVICYLHGATLAAYTRNNIPYIFMSEKAIYNGVKALRGGVPLVFPQFGQPNPTMPQHGILRTSSEWKLSKSIVHSEESVSAVLSLESSEATRSLWPYSFIAELTIELNTKALKYSLLITNTDSQIFECQALLHTYIRIPSIHDIKIHGLHGLPFMDKLTSETANEMKSEFTFSSEVDRIYKGNLSSSCLTVSVGDRELLHTTRSAYKMSPSGDTVPLPCDVVVWNPWIQKATDLTDLGVESYPLFVCLEPGTVSQMVSLEPNEKLCIQQDLVPNDS